VPGETTARTTYVEAATARGLLESMDLWFSLFNDALREIRGVYSFRRFFVRTIVTSSPPDPMLLVRKYLWKLAPKEHNDEPDKRQLNRALQHLEYFLRRLYSKTCR
jgi:hypothetical protein